MGYYIDLEQISIDSYKELLKNSELIPSWRILEENIDKNLTTLQNNGINNLNELLTTLKTKEQIEAFSKQSGLSENYLTILKRMVNGYRQKPNRLKDFTCINQDTIAKLDSIGIKNTAKLYDQVLSGEKRKKLGKETGIPNDEILILTKLADLSRIRWVNHTFAYVLLEAGYDTAYKVAHADYIEVYETVKQLNEERKIYNAHIGIRDMKMVVDAAQLLDFEVNYEQKNNNND